MQDLENPVGCPGMAERSRRRLAEGGHGASVSTRADLECWSPASDAGTGSAIDAELETHYFLEWVRQGGSGCLFAQNRSGQDHRYVSTAMDPSHLRTGGSGPLGVRMFDRLQRVLLDAGAADAVLIHLPPRSTARELAGALITFGRSEHWFLSTQVAPGDEDHVLVSLRWPVPRTFVASEVLGFADLECLPPTRRSPTTTLVLRAAPPPPDQPSVHLAQIPYIPHEDHRIDFYWQGTRSARAALTPAEFDDAAQAPVSFRLPRDDWERARFGADR